MFLSRDEILERSTELFPVREHFAPTNLHEACYDLRVGDEVFLSEEGVPRQIETNLPYVLLPPGQFALVKTFERVRIPKDLIGFISIRSRLKFQGLINISGFHVDPTYEGHLIFSVQNVGPADVRLKYQEPAFMIMFAKLSKPYSGKPREAGFDRITLDQMAQLGGPNITLSKLKTDLDNLSQSFKIYGGIAVSIFVALVVLFLNLMRSSAK